MKYLTKHTHTKIKASKRQISWLRRIDKTVQFSKEFPHWHAFALIPTKMFSDSQFVDDRTSEWVDVYRFDVHTGHIIEQLQPTNGHHVYTVKTLFPFCSVTHAWQENKLLDEWLAHDL